MPRMNIEPGSDLWFAARTGRISASVAAACLRRNPKEGPRAAFNEIMGITTRRSNLAMEFGLRNEDTARQAYYSFGLKNGLFQILHQSAFFIHDEHDWLCCTTDGLLDEDGTLELKCPLTNYVTAVPEPHEIQCRIQIACSNRSYADYYSWRQVGEPYYERIHRDLAIEAELIRDLRAWYEQFVLTSTPPPIRGPRKEKCNERKLAPCLEDGHAADLHTSPGSPENSPGDR